MLLFLLPHLNRWGSALNLIMKKFIIYLRRNKVNGKCYVGQTGDLKTREYNWKSFSNTYANNHINEDRAKYGLDNWTVEVLATTDNREDAWELEQRFINDYNTLWPNGYNISKGGGGHNGCKFSDETKQKLSEANKGEKNPMYGKLNREDKSKQVYQYTLDGTLVKVWPSTMECERNGYSNGTVSECCNGKRKTHKGYRWSYVPL